MSRIKELLVPHVRRALSLPLLLASVPAGFPSPADDYLDTALDLNDYVVRNPAATFFMRASGESMLGAGIHSGDILVVDRSLEPLQGRVVVAAVNGELTVKRLRRTGRHIRLVAENPAFPAIEPDPESQVDIWGVVTYVIHKV
jgi:DNA polymerase V